ncbi:MAG: hypothetical protein ACLRNQ_22880 [Flavonifractor plautii]
MTPLGNALPNDSPVLTNVAGVAFQEQQAGYLAGYAAVKDGFTKLGFSGGGGGTNPACSPVRLRLCPGRQRCGA